MQEDTIIAEKKETKSEVKEKETPSRRKESRDSRDSKDSKSDKKEKDSEDSKETKDNKRDEKKHKDKDKWIVIHCIYFVILVPKTSNLFIYYCRFSRIRIHHIRLSNLHYYTENLHFRVD